jgi:hypothetical protein
VSKREGYLVIRTIGFDGVLSLSANFLVDLVEVLGVGMILLGGFCKV